MMLVCAEMYYMHNCFSTLGPTSVKLKISPFLLVNFVFLQVKAPSWIMLKLRATGWGSILSLQRTRNMCACMCGLIYICQCMNSTCVIASVEHVFVAHVSQIWLYICEMEFACKCELEYHFAKCTTHCGSSRRYYYRLKQRMQEKEKRSDRLGEKAVRRWTLLASSLY